MTRPSHAACSAPNCSCECAGCRPGQQPYPVTVRVVVYRNDEQVFEGIVRPDDAQDYLVLTAEDGKPSRLDCSVPDLTATMQKGSL